MPQTPPPPPEQRTLEPQPHEALLEWIKERQVALAWGFGLVFLALVLIFGTTRHFAKQESEAWRLLSTTTGVEPLRKLVEDYGGTSAGPHLRFRLVRSLLDAEAQLDRAPSGDSGAYDRKLQHLNEALALLTGLQAEWSDPPLAPRVAKLHRDVTRELEWEQKFGKRYVTRTVAPKTGKPLGAIVTKPARPQVQIETNKGLIVLELFEDEAPNSVANFLALTAEGFYDGLLFHRVGPSPEAPAMIQGGDPKGDGTGGPGYSIDSEFVASIDFKAGTICWANRGPNTAGSQFFICKTDMEEAVNQQWKQAYTRFGKVLEGMDVVQKIAKGDRMTKITILKRRGTEADFPYAPRVLTIPGATD